MDVNCTLDVKCNCGEIQKPLQRRKNRERHRCLAHSLVGTPNYIAPEVLLRSGISSEKTYTKRNRQHNGKKQTTNNSSPQIFNTIHS